MYLLPTSVFPGNIGDVLLTALSEDSIVGPRASVFLPDKNGEAGDIGFIVDAAGCRQAKNKPLEARSSFQTEPGQETCLCL